MRSAWKVPGAAYGPGDPHLDHTARESLSEADLRRSVVALRTAFGQLANALVRETPRAHPAGPGGGS